MANEIQDVFLQQCLLCKDTCHTNQLESDLSDGIRFLKENLLKSIKDPSILELAQTFPLCESCWLTIAHLQDMHKQLVAIRKEFRRLRAQFAKEFLEASQNQEKDQQVVDLDTQSFPAPDLSTALEHGFSDIFNEVNNNSNCDIAPTPDQYLVQPTDEQMNSSSGSQQKEIARNHKCPSCDQAFRTRKNLRRHLFIHVHDKDKRFHCEICGKGFSLRDKFRRHKAQVHKIVEQPIRCELCPTDKKRSFYSAAELEKHKDRVHDLNFPINARRLKAARESAREELSNPKPAKIRPRRAAVKKSHCCPLCGKSFDEGRLLQNHYIKEHPEEGSQHQQPQKEAQCEICGQSFSSRSSLKIHANAVHKGIYRYKCQQCTEQFGNKLSLDRHLATHTGKKPLSCNYCEEAFNYKLGLRKHLVKTHPEEHLSENPYACSTCFEVFKLDEDLKKHESEAHFNCQICGKVFRTIAVLKSHEVVHTAQKPFNCHVCGKSFSFKGNLTQHVKGHEGIKPFPCGQCSSEFMRRKTYEQHVRKKHSAQQQKAGTGPVKR